MCDLEEGNAFRLVYEEADGTYTTLGSTPWSQRLRLWLCNLMGHRPDLVKEGSRTYPVDVGPLIGPHQQFRDGTTLWLQEVEFVTEPLDGKVMCRRCGTLVGD